MLLRSIDLPLRPWRAWRRRFAARRAWDLTALLNAADPRAALPERHLWLIRVLEWLRHAKLADDARPAPGTRPTPVLPGWALEDVELDGERLHAGGRVVLDVLGTDTDDGSWKEPARFDPDRFLGVDDYEAIPVFVPHGGAGVATGHRCPGEKLAIAGLAAAVTALSDPRLTVLDAGLEVDRRRLPTMPASGGQVGRGADAARCPFHRGPAADG